MEHKTIVFVNAKTARIRNSFDSPELEFDGNFKGAISYQLGTAEANSFEDYESVEITNEELVKIQGFYIAKRKSNGTWVEGATKKEISEIQEYRDSLYPQSVNSSSSSMHDQVTQLQLAIVGLMQQVEQLGGNPELSIIPVTAIEAELVIKEELDIRDIPEKRKQIVETAVDELLL